MFDLHPPPLFFVYFVVYFTLLPPFPFVFRFFHIFFAFSPPSSHPLHFSFHMTSVDILPGYSLQYVIFQYVHPWENVPYRLYSLFRVKCATTKITFLQNRIFYQTSGVMPPPRGLNIVKPRGIRLRLHNSSAEYQLDFPSWSNNVIRFDEEGKAIRPSVVDRVKNSISQVGPFTVLLVFFGLPHGFILPA